MGSTTYDGEDCSEILRPQPIAVCKLMQCGGYHVEDMHAVSAPSCSVYAAMAGMTLLTVE